MTKIIKQEERVSEMITTDGILISIFNNSNSSNFSLPDYAKILVLIPPTGWFWRLCDIRQNCPH